MQLWVVQYHQFASSDLIVAMLRPKCLADLMGGLPTPDSSVCRGTFYSIVALSMAK